MGRKRRQKKEEEEEDGEQKGSSLKGQKLRESGGGRRIKLQSQREAGGPEEAELGVVSGGGVSGGGVAAEAQNKYPPSPEKTSLLLVGCRSLAACLCVGTSLQRNTMRRGWGRRGRVGLVEEGEGGRS